MSHVTLRPVVQKMTVALDGLVRTMSLAPAARPKNSGLSGGDARRGACAICARAVARRGGLDMTPTDFICPGCGASYKVVRVKAEADPPHRLIHCKVSKRSLAPTDREYILKYFLIRRKQQRV